MRFWEKVQEMLPPLSKLACRVKNVRMESVEARKSVNALVRLVREAIE